MFEVTTEVIELKSRPIIIPSKAADEMLRFGVVLEYPTKGSRALSEIG